ncbi:MAG TPA: hypothetical protein VH721_00135 [Gaiellaceae bacterium]
MRVSLVDLGVALVVGLLFAFALTPSEGGGGPTLVMVAIPALTPGVLNPDVTQETIDETICVTGWTRTVRPPSSYTSQLKVEQMAQYGLAGSPSDYQEDHFVSLELGGHPTDPRNLWPEWLPQAREIDAISHELNDLVCAGKLPLAEAQRRLAAIKHGEG